MLVVSAQQRCLRAAALLFARDRTTRFSAMWPQEMHSSMLPRRLPLDDAGSAKRPLLSEGTSGRRPKRQRFDPSLPPKPQQLPACGAPVSGAAPQQPLPQPMSNRPLHERVHFLTTFLYERFVQLGYAAVHRWTLNIDIFQKARPPPAASPDAAPFSSGPRVQGEFCVLEPCAPAIARRSPDTSRKPCTAPPPLARSQDFLFVPVSKDLHWSLAIVCFPGPRLGRLVAGRREELSLMSCVVAMGGQDSNAAMSCVVNGRPRRESSAAGSIGSCNTWTLRVLLRILVLFLPRRADHSALCSMLLRSI